MPHCRACGTQSCPFIPLFPSVENPSNDLCEMFTDVTEIRIHQNDGTSSHLCLNCGKTLKEAFNFKVMCIKKDAERKQHIINKDVLQKESCCTDECTDPDIKRESQEPDTVPFDSNIYLKVELSDDTCGNTDFDNEAVVTSYSSRDNNDISVDILQKMLSSEGPGAKHKEYACIICEKVFDQSDLIRDHISAEHSAKKTTNSCFTRLHTNSFKKTKTKRGKKRLYCALCQDEFICSASLKIHFKSHFPDEQKKLVEKTSNDQELAIVESLTRCQYCHDTLRSIDDWKQHEHTHSTEPKPFRCNYEACTAVFKDRRSILSHVTSHTQERPFHCNYCTKRFNQRSNALSHERTHTGAKPYLCSECGCTFTESSTLKQHMRRHNGEKAFPCHLCSKSLSTSYSRKVHIRTHSQEKPYMCVECGKSFGDSGKLLIHKRIHSGYRPYNCTRCEASFHDGSGLRRHMKIH